MPAMANGAKGQTDWNAVEWRQAMKSVRNLRQRIFRASAEGDHRTVRSLQKLMLRSYSNALLAVRRVTQVNKGKSTPGVDKVVIRTPKARGELVDQLMRHEPAKPARRVYIPKASGARLGSRSSPTGPGRRWSSTRWNRNGRPGSKGSHTVSVPAGDAMMPSSVSSQSPAHRIRRNGGSMRTSKVRSIMHVGILFNNPLGWRTGGSGSHRPIAGGSCPAFRTCRGRDTAW
jgi:N-terminal domain of reverse transcriptase